ncbi:MAG: hypothetical protein OEN56_10905 [Gemmatimonadota bacterium]|nr:hypothetical protein [Gemmatimonadota bacterium]
MRRTDTIRPGVLALCPGRATRRLTSVLVFVFVFGACGPDVTSVDSLPQGLVVSGHVTVGSNPANGAAGLVDPEGAFLIITEVGDGKYEVAWPLEPGTLVCGHYRVVIQIVEDRGGRSQWIDLQDSTGECEVPPEGAVHHRIRVQFPRARVGGGP